MPSSLSFLQISVNISEGIQWILSKINRSIWIWYVHLICDLVLSFWIVTVWSAVSEVDLLWLRRRRLLRCLRVWNGLFAPHASLGQHIGCSLRTIHLLRAISHEASHSALLRLRRGCSRWNSDQRLHWCKLWSLLMFWLFSLDLLSSVSQTSSYNRRLALDLKLLCWCLG